MERKRWGKPLKHSASCLKKGRGWRHILFHHRQSWDQCNILHKVHWGKSPVLLWIHSSASGQPSYTVHYCVRLKEEEKKRGGSIGGKETCLFVQETGKRACVYLRWPEKARFFPPHRLQGASSPVLCGRSCICVSFSGRQTATPRLLLMMRADVRLVSMNIDVEDSLFHRRTERGKMAAL